MTHDLIINCEDRPPDLTFQPDYFSGVHLISGYEARGAPDQKNDVPIQSCGPIYNVTGPGHTVDDQPGRVHWVEVGYFRDWREGPTGGPPLILNSATSNRILNP
jgi:hypothetical protein